MDFITRSKLKVNLSKFLTTEDGVEYFKIPREEAFGMFNETFNNGKNVALEEINGLYRPTYSYTEDHLL